VLGGCNVVYVWLRPMCVLFYVCVFLFLFLVICHLSCIVVTVLIAVKFFTNREPYIHKY